MASLQPDTTTLGSLARQYPEKTTKLGHVFNDTTNSYKLFWYLSILELIKQGFGTRLSLRQIIAEMVVLAWHPVCFFKLSLGARDELQNLARQACLESHLSADASLSEIRRFIHSPSSKVLDLVRLERFVPTRFLSPWFTAELTGMPDHKRDKEIERLALESQHATEPTMYHFDITAEGEKAIRLNNEWDRFLSENFAIVEAFGEFNLTLYLQSRNPNVPGIVNKLHLPIERNLIRARTFWTEVKEGLTSIGQRHLFQDIFSESALESDFVIDHFLPWSFVAHDLLWNLAPIEQRVNSRKSDALPNIELYLPRLARLHRSALAVTENQSRYLEDYVQCFQLAASSICSLSETSLLDRYKTIIVPQAQIAMNQGFVSNWVWRE